MPVNATRNLNANEVDGFLGNGIFMALGPDRCLVAWGKSQKSKTPVEGAVQFYLPDFYLEAKSPWLTFENVTVTETAAFVETLAGFADMPQLTLSFTPPSLADFDRQFQFIQKAIAKKEINKAVPVIFERVNSSITKAMRARYIQHLLKKVRGSTPYGYLTPTAGMLGASPEVLFSYDARTAELRTMALAGTRSSEQEKLNSLEKDVKEVYEHSLVVKGLREKLAKLGDWQVSPTYVWDLGTLCHLRTDVKIEMQNKREISGLFQELCLLLHPTAALGVSPVNVDFRFLKQCDGDTERGRFGAPFGVLSPEGHSLVLVAIRNMQWSEDGEVRIGSGCGVVEKSDLQSEWQELALKRKSIKSMLGI